jgi:hypothetical protein
MNLQIERLELPQLPGDNTTQLYVLLHGLVSIVETPSSLFLYLIDMADQHEYRAGTWLSELEVAEGITATLTGVTAGNAALNGKENPLVNVAALPDVKTKNVHAIFKVPLPKEIRSYDRGTITVVGPETGKLVVTPDTLSGLRVLVYDVPDVDNVALVQDDAAAVTIPFAWTANGTFTTFENGAKLATLHVFSMPGAPIPAGSDHNVTEFRTGVTVLGADISIDAAVPIEVADPPLLPGLSVLELASFEVRPKAVSQVVLDFIRVAKWIQGGPHNGSCDPCCGSGDGKCTGCA